jgi:hypothetical protein
VIRRRGCCATARANGALGVVGLLLLLGTSACNPYREAPLPEAKCRSQRDCRGSGAICRKGRCRLDGVAEGKLNFFRPSNASWEGLRLVALRSRGSAGRSSARESEQVGKVVVRGKDYRFKFEALPRGLVTIAALCEAAGRRRVAGQVQVVVGWRSGRGRLIGARSTTIPLPIDRARCRRAPRR